MNASVRHTGDGHGNAWNSNYVANPLPGHHPRADLDNDTYIADTVRSHPRPGSNSLGALAIRTAQTGSNGWDEQAYTLDGAQGQAVAYALTARDAKGPLPDRSLGNVAVGHGGVRRLTPLECNRLQGFPDDWDRWTADGREIADSHRYRMMGNAVAVPVLEWIGRRLVEYDRALAASSNPSLVKGGQAREH